MISNREANQMDFCEAHWLWWDFGQIAGSAVHRHEQTNSDDNQIDWDKQNKAMRMAGLSFACSLFEGLNMYHELRQ